MMHERILLSVLQSPNDVDQHDLDVDTWTRPVVRANGDSTASTDNLTLISVTACSSAETARPTKNKQTVISNIHMYA
jgi:hypothetical protein